jgi:hypothetical protein
VADVVQEGGEAGGEAVVLARRLQLAPFGERRQGGLGEVVRAEGVLEPGMRGAGIHQEGVAELADVPEALHGRRVEHAQRRPVEADVVPERVADDLEAVRQ